MSVMKRLSGILQAKANKLLDKAEDPRETLDLSYERQLEMLQQVRRSVADVATARKRIELQAQQLKQSAAKLQDQARQAMSQNREDLAREALTRRAAIAGQLTDLEAQHEQIKAQEDKLVATSQRLQSQVEAFRTHKETMKASYSAAEAQTKIGESVAGISEEMGDAGLALERAKEKVENMQARASAMDELQQSGALDDLSNPTDHLQAELDKTSASAQVELELAQLKGELGPAGAVAGELAGGGGEATAGSGTSGSAPAGGSPGAAPDALSAPESPVTGGGQP